MTRLYDTPFGQVQEFVKRLANAGFTQEMMVRLTNNPLAMQTWVDSLTLTSETPTSLANLDIPIETILDRKLYLMLIREGIHTVNHLIDWTEEELLDIRNCGNRSIAVITATLAEHGLQLATRTEKEGLDDPSRIWSSGHRHGVIRPWKRRDIGHLTLGMFESFTYGTAYITPLTERRSIGEIAAMSDEEISREYGPQVLAWIDENYRGWINDEPAD